LFVLGFNVSLTLFQSYSDGTAWDTLECCHNGTLLPQAPHRSTTLSHIISWHRAYQPYFPAHTFQCRS